MFNTQKPLENDLPSSAQLLKSTIIALVVAGEGKSFSNGFWVLNIISPIMN
jgi:hypothetical protein